MSDEQVYAGVEKALRKYFGKRGDRVVQDNLTCVKRGYGEIREIPTEVEQRVDYPLQGTGRVGGQTPPSAGRRSLATSGSATWRTISSVNTHHSRGEIDASRPLPSPR